MARMVRSERPLTAARVPCEWQIPGVSAARTSNSGRPGSETSFEPDPVAGKVISRCSVDDVYSLFIKSRSATPRSRLIASDGEGRCRERQMCPRTASHKGQGRDEAAGEGSVARPTLRLPEILRCISTSSTQSPVDYFYKLLIVKGLQTRYDKWRTSFPTGTNPVICAIFTFF